MQRANGSLDISFSKNEIGKVHFTTPLRVFNNDDGNNDILSATIVNTSGGIVSGDNHKINVNIFNNTKAQIFSNSAEKIYKSLSNNKSTIDNDIKIGKNSWFEWLPQETILFEDSKLERNLNIFLSENAESLAGEIVVLGRLAKGEYIDNVFFKDSISIYRNSKLEWLDKVLFNGDVKKAKDSIVRLGGMNCFFTIVFSSIYIKNYEEIISKFIRDNFSDNMISSTVINNNIVMRGLSINSLVLRDIFAKIWLFIRSEIKQLPCFMPKLWWI